MEILIGFLFIFAVWAGCEIAKWKRVQRRTDGDSRRKTQGDAVSKPVSGSHRDGVRTAAAELYTDPYDECPDGHRCRLVEFGWQNCSDSDPVSGTRCMRQLIASSISDRGTEGMGGIQRVGSGGPDSVR